MASKTRPDVEAAVAQLLEMANADPNSVSVLMGLAHGFLLLKQTAKARNQLKVCIESDGGALCPVIVCVGAASSPPLAADGMPLGVLCTHTCDDRTLAACFKAAVCARLRRRL